LVCNITKNRDVNDCSFVHFTLILLLHYLVKCRSRRVAVYNNEFILGSACCLRKIIVRLQIIENVTYYTLVKSKDIIPRSRRSVNWNDALTASVPLWDTWLLNVLLALGIKVYVLAFMLEAYIWAHVVIKMMWCDTCDFLRDSKQ